MKTATVVAAALLVTLAIPLAHAQPGDLACNQEPGNRFYWLERAFCDLSPNGPGRAHGIVIWNHGILGTTESWKAPAPPSFRLLQTRGRDVIMLKRHHLAETMPGGPLYRTVQRTLEEVVAQKKLGYRKVVLAGQSFGGYVSLEAVDTSADVDAVVALSPGLRAMGAAGSLDASITDRILQQAKVGRMALVLPKDDALFNYIARGERAQAILSRRDVPYLPLDETSGLSGHRGGVTGRFALRYGLCLAEFLGAPSLPAGRFACPAMTDEWQVVRELLLPMGDQRPNFVRDATALPESVRSLIGSGWGGNHHVDRVEPVAISQGFPCAWPRRPVMVLAVGDGRSRCRGTTFFEDNDENHAMVIENLTRCPRPLGPSEVGKFIPRLGQEQGGRQL